MEKSLQEGPQAETGELTPERAQEKVLLELEMILTTVKLIDSNLIRSIELLQDPIEIGKSGKTVSYDPTELVQRNTQIIREIIETLEATI